ncbi:MAG: glucose-6-phosphate dehydrogenase [Candidatus Izemoplasmatales bacterium]
MKKALVIFGSTGNLMYKKLIPAIYHLIQQGHIGEDFMVYAVARRNQSFDDYIKEAKNQVKISIDWTHFKQYINYRVLNVDNIDDYRRLNDEIVNKSYNDVSIYLATPPTLFPLISKGISQSGFIKKGEKQKRIVFEKPFGEDLESAQSINKELWKYFDESQIYRIDHYLGKEMIQNILVVRFANIIFEQSWDYRSIQAITILAKEEEGVLSRGGYYDKIGALKDMLQSHLLQMAALILMDKPKEMTSDLIKDEKVKIFQSMTFDQKDMLLGQYKGYTDSEKVDRNSSTETFVYAKAYVQNQRWHNVPIHFLTGKKLNEKRSEIIIHFKDNHDLNLLFPQSSKVENKLVIKVSPKEGVEFKFNVKEPGLTNNIHPAILDYCHNCKALENTPEAYERLFMELLNDQPTLFTRWDEIEKTWELVKSMKSDSQPIVYNSYEDLLNILEKKEVLIDDL